MYALQVEPIVEIGHELLGSAGTPQLRGAGGYTIQRVGLRPVVGGGCLDASGLVRVHRPVEVSVGTSIAFTLAS